MSDKLICPYCNKTLHCGATLKSDEYLIDLYQCANTECESTEFLVGCKEFWDILGQHIRTRKALDVAVGALDSGRTLARIAGFKMLATGMDEALEQITATLDNKNGNC